MEGFAGWRETARESLSTVLAWHPSKGAAADRLEPRGASAIKGTCDFNLTLWKDDDRVTLGVHQGPGATLRPDRSSVYPLSNSSPLPAPTTSPRLVALDVDVALPNAADAREARAAILRRMYAALHQSADCA